MHFSAKKWCLFGLDLSKINVCSVEMVTWIFEELLAFYNSRWWVRFWGAFVRSSMRFACLDGQPERRSKRICNHVHSIIVCNYSCRVLKYGNIFDTMTIAGIPELVLLWQVRGYPRLFRKRTRWAIAYIVVQFPFLLSWFFLCLSIQLSYQQQMIGTLEFRNCTGSISSEY